MDSVNKKLRVLHAPIVALYQPYLYVKGLRALGHETDYMVFNFEPDRWLARDCDFDFAVDGLKGLQVEKTREVEFFLHAINNYDIFHFHSGFGLFLPSYFLWERFNELPFLKKLGKKIVMSWWGCDLRTEEMDIGFKYSACNECGENLRKYCKTSDEKRNSIFKAFKYADVHLSAGDLVATCEGLQWIDNAIDCNEWKPLDYREIPEMFRLPETDKIRVYHSFGNSEIRGDVKGTREITAAVEKLRAEGYAVEFTFFDKVPNKALKYFQAQADIVVDQLKCGWYGATATECLAMGKPVITYVRPEVESILPHEHPVINANIHNVYEVLKNLLDNCDKLKEIGEDSRKYALQYHHYINIAKKLEAIYNNLLESTN